MREGEGRKKGKRKKRQESQRDMPKAKPPADRRLPIMDEMIN
jgi:hypothetical protein